MLTAYSNTEKKPAIKFRNIKFLIKIEKTDSSVPDKITKVLDSFGYRTIFISLDHNNKFANCQLEILGATEDFDFIKKLNKRLPRGYQASLAPPTSSPKPR